MNEIVIADKTIRVSDGLYCLNDLHRASGGLKKHQPSNWLKLAQTNEIIDELIKELSAPVITGTKEKQRVIKAVSDSEQVRPQISGSANNQRVIKVVRGIDKPQGTYACRELVYSYAMWISPRFHLRVVRTFDAWAQAERPRLPAVLPFDLAVPKSIEEARRLAAELACERRTLDCKIGRARPWLRYWQDLAEECGAAAHLPEI